MIEQQVRTFADATKLQIGYQTSWREEGWYIRHLVVHRPKANDNEFLVVVFERERPPIVQEADDAQPEPPAT